MQSRPQNTLLCPEIIGRESDLEAIERFLRLRSPRCVLVTGEMGIGKSRLVTRSAETAASLGLSTYLGRCFEQDRYFPYAPVIDLLKSLFAEVPPGDILRHLGELSRPVIGLLPELSSLLPGLPQSEPLDPQQEKQRTFQALTQVISSIAVIRPLLLVIEDIHWSDDTSLEFLLYLARRVASLPVLLLMTYRSKEVHSSLSSFLAALDRERLCEEVNLTPLTRAETGAMLRATLGLGGRGHSEFLNTLYKHTEGNPFFIEEVIKSRVASGDITYNYRTWHWNPSGDLQIPRSVANTVHDELEQLSPPAQDLARLAAVAGRQFDFHLLQALAGYPESDVLELLGELVASQLVVEESAEGFAFRHALIRQTIYSGLLARERRLLHSRVAQAIEDLHGAGSDAHLASLSYHWSEAGAWEKTLDYSYRMGNRAQSLYSPHASVEHYSRAIEATRHISLHPPAGLYRSRALVYEVLGEFELARTDLEAELDLARQSVDPQGEWQALTDLGALWSGQDYTVAGEYFQSGFEAARQMEDPANLAHSLNRLGNLNLNIGNASEALYHHQQALAIFRELKHQRGVAETLDLLGITSYLSGDLVKGTGYYRQVVPIFREMDDRQGLVSALGSVPMRGGAYHWGIVVSTGDRLDDCIRDGEEALQIARDIGWRPGEAYSMFNLGFCLGTAGDFARALEYLNRALEVSQEIEHQQWIAGSRSALGILYLNLLDLDTAKEYLESALVLARNIRSSYWSCIASSGLVSACVQSGDLDRADAVIREINLQTGNLDLGQRQAMYSLAELLLARGNLQDALQTVDDLTASMPNIEIRCVPLLSRLRGCILMELDRFEEAESELQAAKELASLQGALPMLWRVHVPLGKLYRETHGRKKAEDEFAAARAIISGLVTNIPGDSLKESFASRALAHMPPEPAATPLRAAKEASGGLTAREREVARLVASGMSNRQIADALVVSERTVESHISNILSKLSFSSRAQVATWAVQNGLADTSAK